jgi:hypothetical protein
MNEIMIPAWQDDWRKRVMARIRARGFETIADFMSHYPGQPYVKLANKLGSDVAALQLEWLQFGEASSEEEIRKVAMDSLARELNQQVPDGWKSVAQKDFHIVGAFVDWIIKVEQKNISLKKKAQAVWNSLEKLQPPLGWLPSGSQDDLIVKAFEEGWPL